MRPADAVYRALTGRSPRTEVPLSPATFRELERAYGGVARAATAAGVGRETWRRWKAGTQRPRAANLEGMMAAVRRERLAAGRRRRLLTGRPLMTMNAHVAVSSDARDRDLGTGQLAPSQGQISDLIDAYARGDDAAMEAGLESIVGNYVPGMQVLDVHSLWIGSTTWDGDSDGDGE